MLGPFVPKIVLSCRCDFARRDSALACTLAALAAGLKWAAFCFAFCSSFCSRGDFSHAGCNCVGSVNLYNLSSQLKACVELRDKYPSSKTSMFAAADQYFPRQGIEPLPTSRCAWEIGKPPLRYCIRDSASAACSGSEAGGPAVAAQSLIGVAETLADAFAAAAGPSAVPVPAWPGCANVSLFANVLADRGPTRQEQN